MQVNTCIKGGGTMCYFLIDTYIDTEKGRGMYDEYKKIVGMRIASVHARALIVEEE